MLCGTTEAVPFPVFASSVSSEYGQEKCIGPFGKLRAGPSLGVARFARDSASSG
jgi:hypothetical protein